MLGHDYSFSCHGSLLISTTSMIPATQNKTAETSSEEDAANELISGVHGTNMTPRSPITLSLSS